MSRRDKKVTESAGMHPRLDPNLTSDGTENPDAITPVNEGNIAGHNEDMASCGTQGQQARKELQDFLEGVEGRHFMKTHLLEMINLTLKLAMDADQMRKQTYILFNMFKEHQKFVHESLILQRNRMEEFKALCEQYLEKLETLGDSRGDSMAEELRRLLATLKVKLQMVNHQQESAAAQESLLDLLFS